MSEKPLGWVWWCLPLIPGLPEFLMHSESPPLLAGEPSWLNLLGPQVWIVRHTESEPHILDVELVSVWTAVDMLRLEKKLLCPAVLMAEFQE